ncbi:MAG: hypothetical protein AAB460_02965 [Patescibacteria group bacterium]
MLRRKEQKGICVREVEEPGLAALLEVVVTLQGNARLRMPSKGRLLECGWLGKELEDELARELPDFRFA